jgi:hypothetical protein
MRCAASNPDYAVSVSRCTRHPGLFRWTILRRGQPLDVDGYAYATRWMAERAGAVALECYLNTQRQTSLTEDQGCLHSGPRLVPADRPSGEETLNA